MKVSVNYAYCDGIAVKPFETQIIGKNVIDEVLDKLCQEFDTDRERFEVLAVTNEGTGKEILTFKDWAKRKEKENENMPVDESLDKLLPAIASNIEVPF